MPTQPSSRPLLAATSPKAAYETLVQQQVIECDMAQKAVLETLENLHRWIVENKSASKARLLSKLQKFTEDKVTPQGIYIWGQVGRGKSMLMDIFFNTLPEIKKRRVHFHRFMQELHADFHQFRKKSTQKKTASDPIEQLVEKLTRDIDVLCFDELQATDVTDATLITRLFERLVARGVVVVCTSNRPPEELYTGGVQKERFDRLTQLLHAHFQVLSLESPYDYRLRQVQGLRQTYMHPLGAKAEAFIEDVLHHLAPAAKPTDLILSVHGRALKLHLFGERIGKASFKELCEKALGAADYLAIATALEILILTDIPALSTEKRNEAKRFVTLIDALYEHKTKLICTAAAAPENLYPKGDGSFEFARTVSRLIEMQSKAYAGSTNLE